MNSSISQRTNGQAVSIGKTQDELLQLNLEMKNLMYDDKYAKFHGDKLIGDMVAPKGFIANWDNSTDDFRRILSFKNIPTIAEVLNKLITGRGLDMKAAAGLIASLSNDSNRKRAVIESQVKAKYNKMLHPPITYLGDAFQYRQADGKFNNAMNPRLGQAGAPYAKTVPSKTHPLGALPDPGDLFDRLMARQDGGRNSSSGLSAMLIYHATIIIHDIFRTNDNDKNISDSSSYLDLSPLYGYTMEMQRKVRDDKYKLGLLKPDTFAEDRLLRQPPGVCIMLVMYNRYHNYAATQLRRINENGRFGVPGKYQGTKLEAVARQFSKNATSLHFVEACQKYNAAWKDVQAKEPTLDNEKPRLQNELAKINKEETPGSEVWDQKRKDAYSNAQERLATSIEQFKNSKESKTLEQCSGNLEEYIARGKQTQEDREAFEAGYDAAWNKLDDDLFNTARLITCGLYIQVSIHDYLRALMGFHQYNTNFTLDPRLDIDHRSVARGTGNQVTVEFNLLYRFHCAISQKDEKFTEEFMREKMHIDNPKNLPLENFIKIMKYSAQIQSKTVVEPCDITFGLDHVEDLNFQRNPITGLFDDQKMMNALTAAMDDPISNFGPRNTPQCLKPVEIMGIMQARKWEVGTLNDFRDFFGMPRHDKFESITGNVEIQNALRDLYEHPDKIELYPGVFCESDQNMGLDPGPSDLDSALWAAIFSDAITLVRSDRFYTVDWNTNSLTSWGMKEVTEDNDVCKSSVFHRLLQRAFPGWFPYNSIRFFHPFYTAQQNAHFAEQQGYASDFKMSSKPEKIDEESGNPVFNVDESAPKKPKKPVYLKGAERIATILTDKTGNFIHPALKDPANFPSPMQHLFKQQGSKMTTLPKPASPADLIKEDTAGIMNYFTEMTRYIIKRESILMNNSTYQLDATRDFAIPVTTKYVADFLGFGHLIQSEKNPKAPHSENDIYQHITNCQVFMSYNADETKLLKRRKAFKSSIEFIYNLTLNGNLYEASRWKVSKDLFGRKRDNPMTELGFRVAEHVLKHEHSMTTAAAIFVFVALDTAYNSVLAFTSALNHFLKEMYERANSDNAPASSARPAWLDVQDLAFSEDKDSFNDLTNLVLNAERNSIRLPHIRTVLKNREFEDKDGTTWKVQEGDTIILDIYQANTDVINRARAAGKPPKSSAFLDHKSSVIEQFADYNPKQIATMSVTAMVKTVAQMKNPRRGHDAQGRLKKVNIDSSDEGYSNFMAPMRMTRISHQVNNMEDDTHETYTRKILRPATDTYLTAEWDEMVPFPTTWKIRFDGFGKSNYSKDGHSFGALRLPKIDPDALAAPPFYQPQGVSHVGGSFAEAVCVCNTPGKVCQCKDTAQTAAEQNGEDTAAGNTKAQMPAEREPTITKGCGILT